MRTPKLTCPACGAKHSLSSLRQAWPKNLRTRDRFWCPCNPPAPFELQSRSPYVARLVDQFIQRNS